MSNTELQKIKAKIQVPARLAYRIDLKKAFKGARIMKTLIPALTLVMAACQPLSNDPLANVNRDNPFCVDEVKHRLVCSDIKVDGESNIIYCSGTTLDDNFQAANDIASEIQGKEFTGVGISSAWLSESNGHYEYLMQIDPPKAEFNDMVSFITVRANFGEGLTKDCNE